MDLTKVATFSELFRKKVATFSELFRPLSLSSSGLNRGFPFHRGVEVEQLNFVSFLATFVISLVTKQS